jgi:hypothetical protein
MNVSTTKEKRTDSLIFARIYVREFLQGFDDLKQGNTEILNAITVSNANNDKKIEEMIEEMRRMAAGGGVEHACCWWRLL